MLCIWSCTVEKELIHMEVFKKHFGTVVQRIELLHETIMLQMWLYFFQLTGFSYPLSQVIFRENLDNKNSGIAFSSCWGHMPIISVLRRMRQKSQEFSKHRLHRETISKQNKIISLSSPISLKIKMWALNCVCHPAFVLSPWALIL